MKNNRPQSETDRARTNMTSNGNWLREHGLDPEKIWATKDITHLQDTPNYSAAWAYIEQRACVEGLNVSAVRDSIKGKKYAEYRRRGGKASTQRDAAREDARYYRHLERVDAILYSDRPDAVEAAEAEENEEHVRNFGTNLDGTPA